MKPIVTPHDRFFKKAMANKQIALDFFKYYLPPKILAKANLDSLQFKQTSFIDEQLGASSADILYSVDLNGQAGYFYILVEHQSTPDKFMPFRLQGYRWKIMQQHLEQTNSNQLPIVYAIVFYNGKTSYTYSTDILDLFADKNLAEETLYKPFQLINLHNITDETIRQHQWSGLMEFVAKHIYDKDMLEVLHEIGNLVHNLPDKAFGVDDYTVLAFEYIIKAGNINDKQAFINTVKKILPDKIGAEIMTIAELYKQEGKQEGFAAGRFEGKLAVAKKMLAEGFNRDVVAKVTDLPADQVQKLKESESIV